jgi:hypothetical protein
MSRFSKLFPQKTAEEIERDPAYKHVRAEMKPLRDSVLNPKRAVITPAGRAALEEQP